VESTETQAPVADGRQERQLIAGRYRLASFHRGDESTEVWRALDESTTQVVSLEFLRDPDPAEKERFLAGARRLASVQQPSVMRVAAIHDDPDATFIVFEHLVHIPVPLEWLKPVEEPVSNANAPAPATAETVAPSPTAATSAELPAAPDVPIPDVADPRPTDRGLSLLTYAIGKRELSLIDMPLLTESAYELLDIIRAELKAIRVDPTVLSDIRAYRPNFSFLRSPFALLGGTARRVTTMRPSVAIPKPRVSEPKEARPPRMKAVKPPKEPKPLRAAAVPRAPRASSGRGLHVRWGRVLTRGLSLGVLAAILIALPSEMIGNVGSMANDLSVTIREKLAAMAPSTPALQPASFEVPPLSAYSASFESQAPYPKANPNGTVEWVVALRNTGSVGWYLGIDGAQASLALADGTSAGVQTTAYVGPGQVGWFVVHFPAPSQAGTSNISLLPRIDGRGSLPDLGIYATVTVSPNP
jgi:hypothetical protein